jgi:hypothetical protein
MAKTNPLVKGKAADLLNGNESTLPPPSMSP